MSRRQTMVYVQPRFGEPRQIAVVVPRGGRHRITSDAAGMRWLIVRTWYGRMIRRMPIAGYW
ncbi:hypothetical protein [Nocardia brasiliensis]|uniref:hypothetical protein n=1 Tax=Nocardia brasiliensis TaxID=37326 RepID=UPI002456CF1B|nr:hypothetical protein [Nocardia brasiliensis]